MRGRRADTIVAAPLAVEGTGAFISRVGKAAALAAALSLAVVAVVFVAVPTVAVADPLANLGSFGTPNGSQGGQLSFARGVAANTSGVGAPAGSVYVAEGTPNHRVSQFTANGNFVRTWGFNVVDGVNFPGALNDNGTGFEICDVTAGNTPQQCKAGQTGAAAGQLANPMGVAVDQSTGYVYVTSTTNRRVDVFSGTGQFAGAFGWGVDTGAAAPEFCTTASTCQVAGAAGANAGRFANMAPFSRPAIDPNVAGRVYVPDPGNLRMTQYSVTIAAGVLTAVTFDRAFGWDVIPGGDSGLESCTIMTTCQAGQTADGGNNSGQFTTASPTSAAVDSTGAVYATSGTLNAAGVCSATAPCRVQKFAPGASSATTFGPNSGPGQLTFEDGSAGNAVTALDLAVDADNDHLFVLRKETTTSYRIVEYDATGAHVDTHPGGSALTSPTSTTAYGLALGTQNRVYTNFAAGAGAGQVFILGPVDPPTVTIDPVSDVGATTATFTGTVTIPPPGSPTIATRYRFEYTRNGVDWTRLPVPDAQVADGSVGTHVVSQEVTGLEPNTLYGVRLVATTGPSATSSTVSFTTDATQPRVALAFVDEVTQTTARLGAHIDPEGSPTSYHFEWGPTAAYGNRVPAAFERNVGAGNQPVIVNEPIEGLQPATTYHYRVVATNASGTFHGPDQAFETLNRCNLTDGRCYELVSPPDKGPVGAAGDIVTLGQEPAFQAAADRPAIAYAMAYGLPESTSGEEVLYQADRGPSGWASVQLEAPMVSDNTQSMPSIAEGLSENLDCGLFASTQPIGDDPPLAVLETRRGLLYRRSAAGEWTTLTDLLPTNAPPESLPTTYTVIGLSEEGPGGVCGRVVFRTGLHYPGIPGAGARRLYRWDNGVLEGIGTIPGPGGPEVAETVPGRAPANTLNVGQEQDTNYWNAVSDDASRVYFTARSRVGGDAGRLAVFLEEQGSSVAVDVSQSQTESLPGGTVNDDDSEYQTASTDGSVVFFTGRYGLASNADGTAVHSSTGASSCQLDGAGCDLYRYSVETGKLTDVSAHTDGGGAGVVGVLDASDDGSHVYFAARGQLEPGRGPTEAQNLADDTYSVYLAHDGEIDYAGRIRENEGGLISISAETRAWTSRVTPDGRHLLFETKAEVTEYDSQGSFEAYLYSADTDRTVCVSCRRDGRPTVQPTGLTPLAQGGDVENRNNPPRSITDDGRRVFFVSYNRLAHGATEGQKNLYQWEDGQISFLANSAAATTRVDLRFGGASRDGGDVYFTTVDRYTWQDTDAKLDIYDARVGGGFDPPAAGPVACDPLVEGACASGGAAGVGGVVDTAGGGSGDVVSSPRVSFSVAWLSRRQLAALAAGRGVRLAVRVSGAGKVTLRGRAVIGGLRATVFSRSVQARGAGVVRVPVRLSRGGRARLARTGVLRVRVRVRFAGARKAAVRSLVLKERGQARRRGGGKRSVNSDRRTGK